MHSTAIEVEGLLERAVGLLVAPTLDNLRSVENLLREAVVRMPDRPPEAIGRKVRLCGRLLESAEAGRPGSESTVLYTSHGERSRAGLTSRLFLEA